MSRTLNKVAAGALGKMSSAISEDYMITKKQASEKLRITKATATAGRFYMQATLYSPTNGKRKGFNLIRFISGRRVIGGKGKPQLKFKIKRGGGTVSIPGAFIGNAGRTVFIRTGKGRQPIKAVTTIDVPQMFNSRKVNNRVVEYIRERLPIVAQQEINNVLRARS